MPRCNIGTCLAAPSSHTWDEGDGAAGSVLLVQLALADGHLLAHQLLVAAVGVTCGGRGGEVGSGMVTSTGKGKRGRASGSNSGDQVRLDHAGPQASKLWPTNPAIPAPPGFCHLAASRLASSRMVLYMSVMICCRGRGGRWGVARQGGE